MIVLRRMLAVMLMGLVGLLFGACIIFMRAADVAFDPEFLKSKLDRIDAYDFTHDVLLPLAVEQMLEEQDQWLPENLRGTLFPADEAAQRTVLTLLREVFPPEYLRGEIEQLIDALLPYLGDRSDEFAIRFSLADRVEVALGHAPGERSPLESAFRELDMGRALIDGAFVNLEQALAAEGVTPARRDERVAELEAAVRDRDEAAEWFTERLFGAIDGLLPYLLGQSEQFDVRISFAERPALAELLAPLLNRPLDELLGEGFGFSDRDLNEALGEDPEALEGIDRRLQFLREDFVYTQDDLNQDLTEEGEREGATADGLRTAARLARGAVKWALAGVIAVLVLLIGVLGGRRWPTRVMWGAGALLVVSAGWFALFGPVYEWFLEPRARDLLLSESEGWSDALESMRVQLIAKLEIIVGDYFDGLASRTLLWLMISLLAFAAATAWGYYPRRGERAGGDDDAGDEPARPATAPASSPTR